MRLTEDMHLYSSSIGKREERTGRVRRAGGGLTECSSKGGVQPVSAGSTSYDTGCAPQQLSTSGKEGRIRIPALSLNSEPDRVAEVPAQAGSSHARSIRRSLLGPRFRERRDLLCSALAEPGEATASGARQHEAATPFPAAERRRRRRRRREARGYAERCLPFDSSCGTCPACPMG